MIINLLAGLAPQINLSSSALLADVSGGGYVSIFKSVVLIGILFVWAKMLAWADEDAVAAHMPRMALNIGNLTGMIAAYAMVFLLPLSFWLITPIVLVIFAAEVAIYLKIRKKISGLGDLKGQFENWKKGMKKAKKSDGPGPVQLNGKSGPLPVPEGESPDRPAYEAMQLALTEALRKNADQIDLTPTAEGTAIKYLVDCVGYDVPTPLDAETGVSAITYIKSAAGLDASEKRKPQTANLKFAVDGQKREAKIQTAGTTAGEFLRLIIGASKRHALKLPDLGFTEPQFAAVKTSINELGGIVLLATPKGQGLTQLMYGIMRGHDAFLQHLQSIERDPPDVVEGVTANPLAPTATPDEEFQKVDWVISLEPDVLLIDKVESPKSAAALIKYASDGKRVYIGMRAGTSAEAIEQWRKVAGADPDAMKVLRNVIVGRVLRKLCSACKESYTPDPNTLRKLNMNPEKVTTLYKARETPLRDPKGQPIPCTFCNDLRFKGRNGVFEVLTITDDLRTAIQQDTATGGKLGSTFKAAFRKAKGRYLQEEALALVEKGDTSVQEVLRVLKPAEDAPAAAPARAAARPAAARPAAAAAPQRPRA